MSPFSQIAKFTLEEKVNVSTGAGWMNGRCVVRISKCRQSFSNVIKSGQHLPHSRLARIVSSGLCASSNGHSWLIHGSYRTVPLAFVLLTLSLLFLLGSMPQQRTLLVALFFGPRVLLS
jgi:hypothetical protein